MARALRCISACVCGGTGVSDHSDGGSAGDPEIEEAVVSYLRNHPEAADTLDGIVSWWLPLQRYETSKARIEAALTHLVEVGVLQRDRLPDGEKLYSCVAGRPRAPGQQ